MKIVHLIWSLKVGGSESMLIDIANEQVSSAQVVLVVGNGVIDDSVLQALNAKIDIRLVQRPPASRNPWHIMKLIYALRKIGPDIVHAHQNSFATLAPFLSVPMVLTVHEMNGGDSRHLEKFAAVYAISEAVRQDIASKHPGAAPIVIHNGINFAQVTRKTCYGGNPFRIIQVGRLYHETKGQDILLKALHHLKSELPEKQVEVDFVGEGISHDYLCSLAEGLGIAGSCKFLGQQPRRLVYERLHTYDLLVQPSRSEGFGLTVVEAMAAGVPVLVSDNEGPMELIDHGNYGYFFRTGDHLDCGEKIVRIIKDSGCEVFSMRRQKAADYAVRRFDVATTARRYLDECEKVIERSTACPNGAWSKNENRAN